MTPDEEAFLRAICEHPDDDLPRLIYADWLDERGDPRGEFTRVQIERQRFKCAKSDPRNRTLLAREKALLRKHRAQWIERLHSDLIANTGSVIFERGFIYSVMTRAALFAAHASEWFRLEPIRSVTLLGPGECLRDVIRLPPLERVRELQITMGGDGEILPADIVLALLSSPFLRSLQLLSLHLERFTREMAELLIRSPSLASLKQMPSDPWPAVQFSVATCASIDPEARRLLDSHLGQQYLLYPRSYDGAEDDH
jgi:uncharacterized protein (TIGR02996 family)